MLSPGTVRYRDPLLKSLARKAYRLSQGVASAAGARRGRRGAEPRVFYGGARAGDRGGPLVKVQRLSAAFPEHRFGFNLFYSLSNCAYVPDWGLQRVKAAGVPIVHNQNGVFYPAWFDGDWEAENARMAQAYRSADLVFFQSEFCRRAADRFLGPLSGAGEVLYNAVDIDKFAPSDDQAGQGPFRFLITGKVEPHRLYRIESAIAALAQLRDDGAEAELCFAGLLDEDSARSVMAYAAARGVGGAFRLLGAYSQQDAPAIYRAADAYLNLNHQDPCPNAVIEAMACGLPVVHLSNGGPPELVGPDAGRAIDAPEDWERVFVPEPQDVAHAMAEVMADHAAMARAARARAAERFDLKNWLDRHRRAFEDLLETRT